MSLNSEKKDSKQNIFINNNQIITAQPPENIDLHNIQNDNNTNNKEPQKFLTNRPTIEETQEENNINNNINNDINININNDINININNFTNNPDNLDKLSKKSESKKEIQINKEEGQSFSFNKKSRKSSQASLHNNEKVLSKKSTKKKMDILLDYDAFNNKMNEYKDRSNKNINDNEVINSKKYKNGNNPDVKNENEEMKKNDSSDIFKNIEETKTEKEKKSEKNSDEDDGTLFGKNTLKLFDELEKSKQQNDNNQFQSSENNNILGFLNSNNNNNDSDNIMNYLLAENNKEKNNINNNNLDDSDSDSDKNMKNNIKKGNENNFDNNSDDFDMK